MIQPFVVRGTIPESECALGQIIQPGKNKDKLLALKLIKPLPKGTQLHTCHCGTQFITEDALTGHRDAAHPVTPAPQPPEQPAAMPADAQEPVQPAKEDSDAEAT